MRDGTLGRHPSARGMCGTTTSRRCTPACWRATRSRRTRASPPTTAVALVSRWEAARRYLPALLRAAAVTLPSRASRWRSPWRSACSSPPAACTALLPCVAAGWLRRAHPRTPILLQLFVLYYGLARPSGCRRRAALLGLALNYAAVRERILSFALEAVGRAVGGGRHARIQRAADLRADQGTQAFRLALAPMTNDFVALLKDSSLVSVLTVVETH